MDAIDRLKELEEIKLVSWRTRLSAFWLAWRYILILLLLLALSVFANYKQWEHLVKVKAVQKEHEARLTAEARAAAKAEDLHTVDIIASAKVKDDAKIAELSSENAALGAKRLDHYNRSKGPLPAAKATPKQVKALNDLLDEARHE
jgi:hypothetical protein